MYNPCGTPTDVEGRIPPNLKKGLTALLGQEAKILEQLSSNPPLAQMFITNPGAALAKMGVTLDPELSAALRGASGKPNPFTTKTYKLPDGTKITPSFKVSFVGHTTTTTTTKKSK
ncbi:MAG: hypothetical protein OK474_01690 [Thaumarchaeota archaeon]|nr:hypothetical protein [Nitrososphaerota archaeon]